MPKYSETRKLPFSDQQMYDLVADIESYPEFIPWCTGTRIRSIKEEGEKTIVDADLLITFKIFHERFRSIVEFAPNSRKINIRYLEGPLKYLESQWLFTVEGSGCIVEYQVEFEFKSKLFQKIAGFIFQEALQKIVASFEKRAMDIYQ